MLTRHEVRVVALAVVVVAVCVASTQGWMARMLPTQLGAGGPQAQVPATWRMAGDTLLRPNVGGDTARLTIAIHTDSGDPIGLVQAVAPALGDRYAGFTPTALYRWDHVRPGMVALDFTYHRDPADTTSYALGTVVATRGRPGEVVLGTLTFAPGADARRWDVARILPTVGQPTR